MPSLSQINAARTQFQDANGAPLVGGSVETYVVGTSTPVTTYQDPNAGTPNENPLMLDDIGSAAIWSDGLIRMIVKDALGNQIYDDIAGFVGALSPALLAAGTGSSLVGFEQLGANASLRDVLAELRENALTATQFGAKGDGVTDDTAALARAATAASAQNRILDGRGLTYAISGLQDFSYANFRGMVDFKFIQLSPISTNSRVIYAQGRSDFILQNITIDLNSATLNPGSSDMQSNGGIYLDGCSNFIVSNIDVFNGTKMFGIATLNCTDFTVETCNIHDFNYITVETNDAIMGMYISACLRFTLDNNRIRSLGWNPTDGINAAAVAANGYKYTRGIGMGTSQYFRIVNCDISYTDEAFDITGHQNCFGLISDCNAEDNATWGIKLADYQAYIRVNGGMMVRCGAGSVVVSGFNNADPSSARPVHIDIDGVTSVDCGSNLLNGAPNHFSVQYQPVDPVHGGDISYPRGVRFSNCTALQTNDWSASYPAQVVTCYYNNVAALHPGDSGYGDNIANCINNCKMAGSFAANAVFNSGFQIPLCSVNGTTTQAIPTGSATALQFDDVITDTSGMFATTYLSGKYILITQPGVYLVMASILMPNSGASNAFCQGTFTINTSEVVEGKALVPLLSGVSPTLKMSMARFIDRGTAIGIDLLQNTGSNLSVDLASSSFTVVKLGAM